ncbi:MAG: hypothetical protein JW731_02400, partial [Bacteroidales bacterium]|nr:hypothetical protein [Bacteroidales bacterium]
MVLEKRVTNSFSQFLNYWCYIAIKFDAFRDTTASFITVNYKYFILTGQMKGLAYNHEFPLA